MQLRRPLLAAITGTVLAFSPAAAAAPRAPTLKAPSEATIGSRLSVTAGDLRPGRYSLTLALNLSERDTSCVAQIGGTAKPTGSGRSITLAGKVPKTLSCYADPNKPLGTSPLTPGSYHLIVGETIAPAGWSATASFVRAALKVTR